MSVIDAFPSDVDHVKLDAISGALNFGAPGVSEEYNLPDPASSAKLESDRTMIEFRGGN